MKQKNLVILCIDYNNNNNNNNNEFDLTKKWYLHNPELDFEIQTDHLILAGRLDLIIVSKKQREPTEKWTLSSQQTTE